MKKILLFFLLLNLYELIFSSEKSDVENCVDKCYEDEFDHHQIRLQYNYLEKFDKQKVLKLCYRQCLKKLQKKDKAPPAWDLFPTKSDGQD